MCRQVLLSSFQFIIRSSSTSWRQKTVFLPVESNPSNSPPADGSFAQPGRSFVIPSRPTTRSRCKTGGAEIKRQTRARNEREKKTKDGAPSLLSRLERKSCAPLPLAPAWPSWCQAGLELQNVAGFDGTRSNSMYTLQENRRRMQQGNHSVRVLTVCGPGR